MEIKILLKGKFATNFQEEFGYTSLIGVLLAWTSYMNKSHKQNKFEFSVEAKGLKNPKKLKEQIDKLMLSAFKK